MKNNINKGFTIVETMIVLAIAGLILLIVLMAVPALQRSSTNTNIKSDASAIAAGISDFETNNGGALPNSFTLSGTDLTITSSSVASVINSTAKIQAGDVIDNTKTPVVTATSLSGTSIYIVTGQTCNEQTDGRSFAIYFPVLTSGGDKYSDANCVE